MEFISYESLGPFKFDDRVADIQQKCKALGLDYEDTEKQSLKENRKAIYIKKLKLFIVFHEKKQNVFYFEVEKGSLIFKGADLFKIGYNETERLIKIYDEQVEIIEDGLQSNALGISVTRKLKNSEYLDKIEYVLVFNKGYEKEKFSTDDILKHFFGDDFKL